MYVYIYIYILLRVNPFNCTYKRGHQMCLLSALAAERDALYVATQRRCRRGVEGGGRRVLRERLVPKPANERRITYIDIQSYTSHSACRRR